MTKKSVAVVLLLLVAAVGYGQPSTMRLDSLQAQTRRAMRTNDLIKGASLYQQQAEVEKYQTAKANAHYNAACAYARASAVEQALAELKAAAKLGWHNVALAKEDDDLVSLRQLPEFNAILRRMSKVEAKQLNPRKAKLVTSDIDLFWKAYDATLKNPGLKEEIYQQQYFDKGTVGLQDYYLSKIRSTHLFVKNLDSKRAFYPAIRSNTEQVAAMKKQIRAGFIKLKELYPPAWFPSVYFVIGRFNAGGTVSGNGMLISADMEARSAATPLGELTLWERNNLGALDELPAIVAHEHIHIIQKKPKGRTLLQGAIHEGMADFLAELITGKNPNARLAAYGNQHEKELWVNFQQEMAGTSWRNWIANGDQETPEKPADLGYYMGYKICQAYYEELPDKKQAIYDMLNIEDYPAFLAKSRYEEKLALR
ncbi:TPR end-of-group domain-containing protein [Hymenobacter sp. GOD-10R]|uniref:gliding motility protein GldB-related protein n=1 Tax=Hymenobacter sp. GOD-10R TaxID=3093922 RepID=UPI002D77D90E|nr:DUF2268 domain-containing putative Zn-dependent protease [Hymenobacter sp. GOD-10R]WRQ29726.1 DUF2268 domain-containing putative Zn-dependent protease [Hymenobacter sp. GOD-10R]